MVKNVFKHFIKICKHKHYVRQYCWAMGLYWQGVTHDLSKFSPIEFWESVKYYCGDKSPIDKCKAINGISYAWLHHKGRNPHHYEYWMDNFDNGGSAQGMPAKYIAELIADYLGAGKAYTGKNKFTYEGEYEWWVIKSQKPLAMHYLTKGFIDYYLKELAIIEHNSKNKKDCDKKIEIKLSNIIFDFNTYVMSYAKNY